MAFLGKYPNDFEGLGLSWNVKKTVKKVTKAAKKVAKQATNIVRDAGDTVREGVQDVAGTIIDATNSPKDLIGMVTVAPISYAMIGGGVGAAAASIAAATDDDVREASAAVGEGSIMGVVSGALTGNPVAMVIGGVTGGIQGGVAYIEQQKIQKAIEDKEKEMMAMVLAAPDQSQLLPDPGTALPAKTAVVTSSPSPLSKPLLIGAGIIFLYLLLRRK